MVSANNEVRSIRAGVYRPKEGKPDLPCHSLAYDQPTPGFAVGKFQDQQQIYLTQPSSPSGSLGLGILYSTTTERSGDHPGGGMEQDRQPSHTRISGNKAQNLRRTSFDVPWRECCDAWVSLDGCGCDPSFVHGRGRGLNYVQYHQHLLGTVFRPTLVGPLLGCWSVVKGSYFLSRAKIIYFYSGGLPSSD